MSLPVFLYDLDALTAGREPAPLPEVGAVGELAGPEARHAVTVVRMTEGEELLLVDGQGSAVRAVITAVTGKDRMQLRVEERLESASRSPRVTIVQALPKSERSELAVDLMTQGGVDEIVPWQSERAVSKWVGAKADKGVAKWRSMALSAAKQSRRLTIPVVAELATTNQIENRIKECCASGGLAVLLHEEAAVSFRSLDFQREHVLLVVGPEGGLSPQEVERFTEAGAQTALLGPEVLRTASAGIVALSAIGVLTSRW